MPKKKARRHDWPEAKHLCRLNQNDIAMAKRLGFRPETLIRAIPSPQQRKWKLPVKLWIHDLYEERFGVILGEKPVVSQPPTLEETEEARRRFEEEQYREDYYGRNRDNRPSAVPAPHSAPHSLCVAPPELDRVFIDPITDEDVPF